MKNIDLTKKLSAKDRAWLKEWSMFDLIQANDREFGVEQPVEAPNLKAHQWFDDESKEAHEPRFAQHPLDPEITGHWSGQAIVPDPQKEEAEEREIEYLTTEELKEELRARDLSTSGNKQDLVDRLEEAVKKEK
jgi:hypothetical protein